MLRSTKFINTYALKHSYILAAPDLNNVSAIKAYSKAGFIKMITLNDEVRMLYDVIKQILEQLKTYEPIFIIQK